MKWSITKSVIAIVILLPTVSFGSPNLSGQYWFGSLSIDVDTNAPLGKRGTVSISGNQWDQEWDDYNGHHTFSSAFTTTDQPDGSINVNFPGETYNVAWNGDVMIHAGSVLGGSEQGFDILTRIATNVDVDDILGDHSFFGHHLNSPVPGDSCGWGDFTIDPTGTATGIWTNDNRILESATMDWTIDEPDATINVWGPTINELGYATMFLGEGGIACTWEIVPEEGRDDLGYAIFIKKTDHVITMADIADTYQVRFLETGPGGVPYTCGQGTCVLETDGSFSVDAYYSNGEHDVFGTTYTVGPGNEFHLDDDSVPDGIISLDKNLIFIPEYRYENPPTRTGDDWLGGIFLIRVKDISVVVEVPNAVGLPQADAQSAMTAAGLVVGNVTTAYSNTVPAGNVISQSPAGGSSVAEGSAVDLVISNGQLVVSQAPVSPDFNGDGKTDILWRKDSTGLSMIHLMNGLTISSQAGIGGDLNWEVVPIP